MTRRKGNKPPERVTLWSRSDWAAEQRRQEWHNVGKSGYLGAAGAAVAPIVLTAGMIRNRRFRYVAQAVLHFPFSFAVVFVAVFAAKGASLPQHADDQVMTNAMVGNMALAFAVAALVSTVWSLAYIRLRTVPKMRRLREQEARQWSASQAGPSGNQQWYSG